MSSIFHLLSTRPLPLRPQGILYKPSSWAKAAKEVMMPSWISMLSFGNSACKEVLANQGAMTSRHTKMFLANSF